MREFEGMANEGLIRTICGTDVTEVKDMSLRTLFNMSDTELTSIKGVGKKTAEKIKAAFELGLRLVEERTYRNSLDSSLALYNRLLPLMSNREVEHSYLIIMNQNFKELKIVELSKGGITETCMDVREIIRHTCINRGTIIAIAHNHPSGEPTPSRNDDELTKQIADACKVCRIFFMDHIIIGDGNFYSYHDKGML